MVHPTLNEVPPSGNQLHHVAVKNRRFEGRPCPYHQRTIHHQGTGTLCSLFTGVTVTLVFTGRLGGREDRTFLFSRG
jgi:hypothetical protein